MKLPLDWTVPSRVAQAAAAASYLLQRTRLPTLAVAARQRIGAHRQPLVSCCTLRVVYRVLGTTKRFVSVDPSVSSVALFVCARY